MTTFAEAIQDLPPGTIVSLTLKGTGRVIIGAVVGPYTRDIRPSVLIDTRDGSDFPQVAVALATIADGHEIGGSHSGADVVPISLVDETEGFYRPPAVDHHAWDHAPCRWCGGNGEAR